MNNAALEKATYYISPSFADKIDEKRLVRDFLGARHTGKYVAATKKSNNRFSQF